MSPLESGTERKPRDRVRILLYTSVGLLLGGVVFTSVCAIIWPRRYPAWVVQVNAVIVLAGVLVLSAGVVTWLRERGR